MLGSIPRARQVALPDLPALPPLALHLLGAFLLPILTWVETLLLRAVLTRCAEHPLLQIAQTYDPTALVTACAAYRHPQGTKGAPPTFTIEQLVRAEIVRAWADSCSDPELEWLLASNLLARHFVGLSLLGPTPDHATLSRFHAFLSLHAPDALFRDVLAFLDRVDPEDPSTTPQIVDSFAMASPAAPALSVASLLRHLTRRLARAWISHAPVSLQHALPPLDLSGLVRTDAPRTPQEAQQRLVQAVSVATWVADGLTPYLAVLHEPLRTAIAAQVRAIGKIIADETSTDANGLVQERQADAKGSYRIASAVRNSAPPSRRFRFASHSWSCRRLDCSPMLVIP
ncbi:MAG TPA: transposase [Myxococcota bacterium]|nr:transposase [Myxococcota bacterium]